MLRKVGRGLQHLGLIIPPIAILLQLVKNQQGEPVISLLQMLGFLLAAVCGFWIGRIIEGYASK